MTRHLRGPVRAQMQARLRARYEQGATIRDLCAETGRSYGAIRDLLLQAGTTMRPRRSRSPR